MNKGESVPLPEIWRTAEVDRKVLGNDSSIVLIPTDDSYYIPTLFGGQRESYEHYDKILYNLAIFL